MTRRLKVPYSLSRKRLRASLNKYNVYNALTWRKNRPLSTQYRQVFFAKQETRSYHGDKLTENQFKNHFRGELPVVSPLSSSKRNDKGEEDIPYALQTYVGLERRLDFAVFRSLFASSVRQAAVFILRGSVKVNGVRIKSPGYIMRPGDMFSVDPRRVLYALGRTKPSKNEAVKLTNRIIKKFNAYIDRCHKNPEAMWKRKEKNRKRHHVYNAKHDARKRVRAQTQNANLQREMNEKIGNVKPAGLLESVLTGQFKVEKKIEGVVNEIKKLVPAAGAGAAGATGGNASEGADSAASTADTSASAAPADAGAAAAASSGVSTPGVKKLLAQLAEFEQERIGNAYRSRMIRVGEPEPFDPKWVERLPPKQALLDAEQIEDPTTVKAALPFSTNGGRLYGLSEPNKTWFTPWTPRPFLAPFAVLPHHIEIDYETCHAVYLRDPVARPGHSEVLSPFSLDMHERSYLWYINRRRKNLPKVE